jgi:NAD(P)H-dependent flavin oxidoreductase YrpB (nitropropane dioxygenase family)
MKKAQELTLGQMAMAANAPMLTRASMVDGRPEVGILPTGQVVGAIDELPSVQELVERIVREAEETLARLGSAAAVRISPAAEVAQEASRGGARS